MKLFLLLIAFLGLGTAVPVMAQLSGGTYEIYADTFSFVSTGYSSSGAYTLFDSGGEFFAATSTGGDYSLRGGFRAEEKGFLRVTLSSGALSLGELSTTSVSVASTTITIETDNFSGYTLAVRETDDLSSGADDIDDVVGFNVVAGTEAYGVSASGSDATLSGHNALTGAYLPIANNTSTVSGNDTEIGFRASISDTTPTGAYSHTVQFLATVNL